jgi:hypothetical protein
LKTSDEKIADYRAELEQLTIDYNEGTIPLEIYTAKTQELNDKIALAEAEHKTL